MSHVHNVSKSKIIVTYWEYSKLHPRRTNYKIINQKILEGKQSPLKQLFAIHKFEGKQNKKKAGTGV